jgi:hypothetical protein
MHSYLWQNPPQFPHERYSMLPFRLWEPIFLQGNLIMGFFDEGHMGGWGLVKYELVQIDLKYTLLFSTEMY